MSARGGGSMNQQVIHRNLALELLRVTEGAALAAAPLQGRGDKEAADERAVQAMRSRLGSVDMDVPVEWNLIRIAKAEGHHPRDLTVIILDRERNKKIIEQVRDVGARIS